jgi:long-chain fatty acid transport protein
LAGFLTNNVSIGGGIDFQYATVEFNRTVGAPAVLNAFDLPPTAYDSQSTNKGNSFGIGFHAGALFMLNENHTRVGVNYQSEMRHQFNGYSQLTGRLADPTFNFAGDFENYTLANPNATYRTNTLSSNNVALPAVVTVSAYQDVNEKLAILGSVVYTGWGAFRTIKLNNIAAGVPINNPDDPNDGFIALKPYSNTTTEGYRNVWRAALGANYRVNQQWMMRFGGGYDQTPTVNAHRDVRLPDSDRWALSIGTHYQPWYNVGFDAGYTYLFAAGDATVNNSQAIGATSVNTINAVSQNHAQLFGLQVVWMIDKVKPDMGK